MRMNGLAGQIGGDCNWFDFMVSVMENSRTRNLINQNEQQLEKYCFLESYRRNDKHTVPAGSLPATFRQDLNACRQEYTLGTARRAKGETWRDPNSNARVQAVDFPNPQQLSTT